MTLYASFGLALASQNRNELTVINWDLFFAQEAHILLGESAVAAVEPKA